MKKHNITKFLVCFILFIALFPSKSFSEDTHKKNPSIMFMIAEQNIGKEHLVYWWKWLGNSSYFLGGGTGTFVSGDFNYNAFAQEFDLSVAETTLKEEFINQGFDVVDISKAKKGKIKVSNVYKYVDLKKDVMIELGKNCGADVVVKGKALAKKLPQRAGSSIGTYMADITASAIRVKDGRVLGSARGHGVSRHIYEVTGGTQALEKASRQVAEKLMEQIERVLNK